MKCRYMSGDLNQRLNHSFVMYDGEPCYVLVHTDDEVKYALKLYRSYEVNHYGHEEGPPIKEIFPYDPEDCDDKFDISSIPLGYVNWNNRAIYLKRHPYRAWKQGICTQSVTAYEVSGEHSQGVQVSKVLSSHDFHASVCGKFPALKEAVRLVLTKGGFKSMAISKDIAIEKVNSTTLYVYLKGMHLGVLDAENKNLSIVNIPEKPALMRLVNNIDWSNI